MKETVATGKRVEQKALEKYLKGTFAS